MMDINIVYGILLAIGLSVLIMIVQKRKMKESWEGVITKVEKEEREDDEGIPYTYYHIHYRTEQGKKGKLSLTEYQFNTYFPHIKEGDRLIKETGEMYPKIY
jgi:MFS superfamily sulfate permease-like transporter